MKRWLGLVIVAAMGIAALVVVQRRHDAGDMSANAVLNMAADVQRDVMRAPMQVTRLSDQEETQIGDAMAERYIPSQDAHDSQVASWQRITQRIGGRLAAHAHRKLNYRFHVIPDQQFLNAFALPGGHVFIGLGLLKVMDTEDELASVLGHELEHIDHYHCIERLQVEAQLRKLQLGVVSDVVQLPLTLFEVGYSKDEEAEADREGLLLAASSGFSPYGAVTMFEKFVRLHRAYVTHASSPPEELTQLAIETLTGYFRSHPLPEERVAKAKDVIREHRLESRNRQTPLQLS
jgi:beta-barrel assembly-enhancing protease